MATVDFGSGTGGDVTYYTTAATVDHGGDRRYIASGVSGPSGNGIFFAALILTRKGTGVYIGDKPVHQILKGRDAVREIYKGLDNI